MNLWENTNSCESYKKETVTAHISVKQVRRTNYMYVKVHPLLWLCYDFCTSTTGAAKRGQPEMPCFFSWERPKVAKLTKTTLATLPSLNLFFFCVLYCSQHVLKIYWAYIVYISWFCVEIWVEPNIPGRMGVGPSKLLVVRKGLKHSTVTHFLGYILWFLQFITYKYLWNCRLKLSWLCWAFLHVWFADFVRNVPHLPSPRTVHSGRVPGCTCASGPYPKSGARHGTTPLVCVGHLWRSVLILSFVSLDHWKNWTSSIDPMQKGVSLFLSYTNINKVKSLHHMKEHPKIRFHFSLRINHANYRN